MPQGHGLASMRPSSRRPQPPARCGAWDGVEQCQCWDAQCVHRCQCTPLFCHLHDRQVPSRGADSRTAQPSTVPRPVDCHHHALADVRCSDWMPPMTLLMHQLHLPTCQRQGKHWRRCVGRPTHVKDAAAWKHRLLLQPPLLLLVGMLMADRKQVEPATIVGGSADSALRLVCLLCNAHHAEAAAVGHMTAHLPCR